MDTKYYKNKYLVPSSRLRNWDYGTNATYFVTICTHNRTHDFGKVQKGMMNLTQLGQSAVTCWQAIPNHFPFVTLDEYVIMPNHVHGVLIISKPAQTNDSAKWTPNQFGPQSKNLGSIIRGFKIGVTKFSKSNGISFRWQPRFHDHIVRTDKDLERIRRYIRLNPQNWDKDSFFTGDTPT